MTRRHRRHHRVPGEAVARLAREPVHDLGDDADYERRRHSPSEMTSTPLASCSAMMYAMAASIASCRRSRSPSGRSSRSLTKSERGMLPDHRRGEAGRARAVTPWPLPAAARPAPSPVSYRSRSSAMGRDGGHRDARLEHLLEQIDHVGLREDRRRAERPAVVRAAGARVVLDEEPGAGRAELGHARELRRRLVGRDRAVDLDDAPIPDAPFSPSDSGCCVRGR